MIDKEDSFERTKAEEEAQLSLDMRGYAETIISGIEFLRGGFRFLKFTVVVLIVLSLGSFFRSYIVQDAADKATAASTLAHQAAISAKDASEDGRDAAIENLAELRVIIRRFEEENTTQPPLQNQEILDALEAVARIEQFLCDGICEPG